MCVMKYGQYTGDGRVLTPTSTGVYLTPEQRVVSGGRGTNSTLWIYSRTCRPVLDVSVKQVTYTVQVGWCGEE